MIPTRIAWGRPTPSGRPAARNLGADRGIISNPTMVTTNPTTSGGNKKRKWGKRQEKHTSKRPATKVIP